MVVSPPYASIRWYYSEAVVVEVRCLAHPASIDPINGV